MKLNHFKVIFIALMIPICEAKAQSGAHVPLLGRDVCKVMNFHDVVLNLNLVRNFLDDTGGRLNEGEIVIFFAAHSANSSIVRIPSGTTNGKISKTQIYEIHKDDLRSFMEGEKSKVNMTSKRVSEFNSVSLREFAEIAEWMSVNKVDSLVTVPREEELVTNFQIFVISNNGISIIDHTLSDTLTEHFVNASAYLLSAKKVEEFSNELIEARKKFSAEMKKELRSNPRQFIQTATSDGETGETESSIANKVN